MSGASWSREFGGLALSLLGSLLGWVLIAPLAALIPKRRDWIAVIGRQHGKFLDNAKYFYLQGASQAPDLRLVFITERADVIALFASKPSRVLHYPGFGAIWYLLRCGSVVVDSTDWIRHLRRFLLIRSQVVQLWHGVGFKRIELDKWRNETGRYRWFSRPWVFSLRMMFYRVTCRVVRYAAVATTSSFYRDEVFVPAFLARHFPVTGYPRNVFNNSANHADPLVWANVDADIAGHLKEWTTQGRRLVMVTPTMRDSGAMPMQLNPEAVQAIDAFAEAHGFEFVFKFHPSDQSASQVTARHVHACSPDSDIYPLLPHACSLITDYSSIYMDFLLLDRPVLFLIPDGDSYMRDDRQVQFDLTDMMPGPRLTHWSELLQALAASQKDDSHIAERARLQRLAFDNQPQANATTNILDFMAKQGWVVAQKARSH